MDLTFSGVGPVGRAIIERDLVTLSPSYSREYPLVIDRAEGSEIWDVDGRRYVDFMAGVAVLNVGHRHPAVWRIGKKNETVNQQALVEPSLGGSHL